MFKNYYIVNDYPLKIYGVYFSKKDSINIGFFTECLFITSALYNAILL